MGFGFGFGLRFGFGFGLRFGLGVTVGVKAWLCTLSGYETTHTHQWRHEFGERTFALALAAVSTVRCGRAHG